ncbi:MAG: YdeI/OmpD-associated family protein [Flavobacteriia bacterium]|nr:YdeI/OmpD-associated family protein [Flavobacteriia bacterium]
MTKRKPIQDLELEINKAKVKAIHPVNREAWRNWLEENHKSEDSIWLVYTKKHSASFNLTWEDAVEEALCFGWIDSIRRTLNNDQFVQYFSQRRAGSTWSAINKKKVIELEKKKLMHASGKASIKMAKEDGSWTYLDDVEALILPDDLKIVLHSDSALKKAYEQLAPSKKKFMLYSLKSAVRPETRAKRLDGIIEELRKLKDKR